MGEAMTEHNDGGIWPNIWIMKTADGFYPIQPSDKCKPEDHGNLNPHVVSIENMRGDVLWTREATMTFDPTRAIEIIEARAELYRKKASIYSVQARTVGNSDAMTSLEIREDRMRHTAEALDLVRNEIAREFGLTEKEYDW